MKQHTNGVLYIAFSNKTKHKLPNDFYLKEAIFSAASIKKRHPELNITLFTDKDPKNKNFDNVKIIEAKGIRIKQDLLWESPYDRTLYLDSDTEIVGDITSIFGILDKFDIAATHDLIRKDQKKSAVFPDYDIIPDGFSELGGGVILFKKSENLYNFFSMWRLYYKRWKDLSGRLNDQPSFRVALWHSPSLRLYILPPEYNIRFKNYNNIVDRVLHQHSLFKEKK